MSHVPFLQAAVTAATSDDVTPRQLADKSIIDLGCDDKIDSTFARGNGPMNALLETLRNTETLGASVFDKVGSVPDS